NIAASGTTGITLSGAGAGLSFTGGGTNVISATGTLTINAFTLGGAITAAGNNITSVGTLDFGTNNLSLTGTTISTSGNNNNLTITPNGSGNTILTTDANTGIYVGSSSNTPAPLSVSGGIGDNAALIVNQTNSGDILAASASGVTKFAVANDGTVKLFGATSGFTGIKAPASAGNNTLILPINNGLLGQGLITDGFGNLSWSNVSTGFNPWDLVNMA